MIGQTLGHYRILEKVGEGGMGEVYRARDERLDRDVALKVLPAGTLIDEATRKRFHREAQALAKLNHANIGTVYDFNSFNGLDVLVMEYIPGVSLADKLDGGSLGEKEVAKLGSQIAAALAEAHENGVVHRDLKPGNIMITPKGQAKVLDFGLAKLLPGKNQMVAEESLTQPQVAVGTLPYMAPEQLRGEPVDARTDIFSAGVIFYEMATGKRPFTDTLAPRLIDNIINRIPQAPSALNERLHPEVERIILKCLEKDPENRYQSSKELEIDLRRFYSPTSATVTQKFVAPRSPWQKAAPAAIAVAVVFVLLVALDVGGLRTRLFGGAASGPIRSLAVLPLQNLSGDPQQEYFVDGMTEALITELSRIRSLKITSRTSVMRYKGANKPLPEIARELNVDAVVEGSVLRAGGRVRVTAQLIRAATDAHLWADNFESDLRDVLKLQNQVAQSIAQQIQAALTPAEEASLVEARTVDPEAYDLYLRGRAAFYRYNAGDLKEAIAWYEKALAHDSDFAPAYAGLALAYAGYHNFAASTDRALLEKAESYARESLRRRAGFAEGYFALGFTMSMSGNWVASREAYLQALALEPNHAHAHAGLGYVYENTGFLDLAEDESKRASLLDPQLGPPYWHISNVHHARGDHRAALAAIDNSPVRDWALSAWQRARELYELGEVKRLPEIPALAKKMEWGASASAPAAAFIELAAGRRDAARKAMDVISPEGASNPRGASLIASIHATAGDSERALQWLDLAVSRGYANYPLLARGSEWQALQKDAQFQRLLAEVKARHEKCRSLWK